MFWFIEANVQLCDTHTLKPQNFKVMRERHGSPSSSHLQVSDFEATTAHHEDAGVIWWFLWAVEIQTAATRSCLTSDWGSIWRWRSIRGPLFEACSSVVFESRWNQIRWKSRRCWTLTRLHTRRESDSFDCSHRNHRSITITLGGMKVRMCLFIVLIYLCCCIIYTQYEQKQTADELQPKGANLFTVVSFFSIYF